MSDLPGVYKPLSEADTETRHVLNRPTPARFDREYPYVAPPGSDHTLHELDYLISLIPLREKWGALIKEADENMEGLFFQLCGDLGVPCDEADLRRRTREAAIPITKLKWRYNRPRPYQVAAKHGRLAGQGSVWKEGDFSVLDSVSAHTPAYPSGHTIQAKLLASYLSEIAPQHRKAFMGLADNISFSRVVAGYHWPSDASYGEDVFRHMVMPDMPSSVRVAARKTSRREILDKALIQRFRKDILALARAADKARTLQDAQQVSAAANRWGAHFDSFTATLRKDLEDRRRSAERDYHREFNPTPPALDDVEYYLDRGGLEKMWNLDLEVRRIPSGRIELKNRGGSRWKPPEQVREELLQFWLDRGDTAEEAEIKVDDYLLRRPSWTREEAEAHAVAKWKEEARKWARRVRDKARPVWPRLEQLAEWMEGRRGGKRSLEFITPEEEVVDLSGFRVVFRGFAESPYQDELPRLKEGLARFRRAAQARAPIILKRIVPIHIEWTFEPTSRGDAGAYYTRGMIYVTPWEIGKDMGRFVHVLAHEMGHHLYQTVLSGQASKEWDSFIRGTYTDLDLRDVLRRMEALGATSLVFDKALREDPILYLQLEGLQQSRRELRNLMDADDVREYLDAGGDPNVRVMAMPISGYAHKNPQEAFCEALGKLVAYGPKAVPDVVLGMLRRVLPTVRISSDKQAYVSTMPATEDCDAIVSAAWVSPQGKMVFLRGQTHEGFAEKWALRNEPDLHAQIVEHGQTARPHASIWHRVMLDRGWLQLQGMSSIVVPPRPSRKQLQNVADFFANCIADGTSDPDRITLHIFGLSPSLKGKPIEPGEDRYPFDVQERVSLADFIEREASGPVIEDMYQAMMERTRRASLIEAWGPMYREARGCDVEHSWAWISPSGKLIEVDDHGGWGIENFPQETYEATLRDLSRKSHRERDPLFRKLLPIFLKAVVFDPDNWETAPDEVLKKGRVYQIPEKTREKAEKLNLPNLSEGSWGLRVRLTPAEERFLFQEKVFPEIVRVNINNARNKRVRRLWKEEWNSIHNAARRNASEVMHKKGWISASHWAALGGAFEPSPKQWESFFQQVLSCWKKNGTRPDIVHEKFYLASGKAYEEIPYEEALERYCPRHLQDEIYEYLLSDSASRTARGKAKKDVGHGGLDEWFSGHGGAKGKGEDATWGDWVSISPVTKTLPSGKKVEKGDIVGECGISDDPDWKEITKGGEDPLKCMPRSKAYDMPKKERAEKAKAKQKAEKADSSRGKKPTMTPTFDKPKKKASGIDRVFRSPKPFTGFRPVSGQGHDFKPKGLWYSCGSAWDDWCRYEMPSGITGAPYVYRIEVNLSRMIVIRNAEDFKDFESKYGVLQRGMMMIDWKEVARDYDGIEICPYQHRFRMSSMWYYGWDVASGCIWGSGAFKAVESLESCGPTERVARRKLANDAHKAQIALMKFLSDVARKHRVGDHVYVVGGAVRNFVIDRPIKDIDVVIDTVALGERFRKPKDSEWFAKTLQGRIPVRTDLTTNQYGVAILTVKDDWIVDGHNLKGEVIEIANARKESYGGSEGKGYKPDQVVPATIEEDLLRREFTFNTLLWRLQDVASGPEKAEIVDLTGCGLRDLNNMTMRCPRDPDIVFADDPTRMLRAIKFATKYGFKIPKDLAASIRKNAAKMKQAPWEAIATIFINNVLNEPTARTALKQMKALGLLDVVAEMVQEQKPFASYLTKQLRDRNVALLLDLLDLGLTNPTPLKFLTRNQQIRLREITVPMESGDADALVAYLAKPQVDNGSLIRDFDLKGSSRSLPVAYAREALLENPDLMGNRAALDAAIRDLFRSKGTSRQASLSDLWGRTLLGAEAIPGGKARGMKPTDFDSDELDAGIEVEHEHLVGGGYSKEDARAKAREIAMDHLAEIPDYYTRLDKMESAAGVKHAGLSTAWGKTLEERHASGAPTAEGAFYKDPRKSEVREFAETKAISNDLRVVEQAAPELDVPESKAIQEAKAAPPTPVEIAKEPGGGAVSTLNRYVVETEDPAAEPAAIENQVERVGEAGVKEASVSPLDLERFAARIERLQRTRTHGWNPADGLEFKNMLPSGRGHRRLPDPKKLREIARDTPFSDEDSRFVSSNWRNWMTWALRAEGLIRDNDPRNPRRMMRDMARGRFPGGR
jgi:tRNA nucleotidyltransferase/poly(A) polymerase